MVQNKQLIKNGTEVKKYTRLTEKLTKNFEKSKHTKVGKTISIKLKLSSIGDIKHVKTRRANILICTENVALTRQTFQLCQ